MLCCTVTGHRPNKLPFHYNEKAPLCLKIKEVLKTEIGELYAERCVRRVLVGGALGVDMWAGEAVIALQREGLRDLQLCVALPFPGHDTGWFEESRMRLNTLRAHAEVVTVCTGYTPDAYKQRNFWMVDRAQFLIAVYSCASNARSGTGQTVRYAQRQDKPTIFINPDTGSVQKG